MINQNQYGELQLCCKCNKPLEKARTKKKNGVCLKCQRKHSIEHIRRKKYCQFKKVVYNKNMEKTDEKYKIAIVVPVHIQPSKEWVQSLQSVTKNYSVIIVDDSNGKVELPKEWDIYDYSRQQELLGDELYKEFEQFHKSSACRNFGHWVSYIKGYDITIGLDSDCIVPPDFISKHLEALMSNSYAWENPIKNTNWFPRGYPYHERNCRTILNIGLWENELDINGIDRVHNGVPPKSPMIDKQEIAHGIVPLCGMNFAIWTYAVPAFLFLPNFDDGTEKFRRYDDIWGGYIFQKLMQKNKEMITFGNPIVFHDTIIDAEADAELEDAGIKWEEKLYEMVDIITSNIDAMNYSKMFKEFSVNACIFKGTPFEKLLSGIEFWVKVFEKNNE